MHVRYIENFCRYYDDSNYPRIAQNAVNSFSLRNIYECQAFNQFVLFHVFPYN